MAAWLLQKMVVGKVGRGKDWWMSQQSQIASFAMCVAATYSASAVDRVTSSCLREYQEMAPPSIMNA